MKTVFPLLFVLAAASVQGSVDFTATISERVLDGIKFQQLVFHEDGRPITYEQPRGWTYSADAVHISFTPPNVVLAQASIQQSPLPAPQNFDEATILSLRQQVLDSLPPDSSNSSIIAEETNPVLVNRHETYEVIVAYEVFGQEFQRSVLFLDLPDTQLRFRVTSCKQDFEKLHKAFRGSIYSWQWK